MPKVSELKRTMPVELNDESHSVSNMKFETRTQRYHQKLILPQSSLCPMLN